MFNTPQILPISDIQNRHLDVMGKLSNGPVFLTHKGEGAAVLLSNDQWDSLMCHMEQQADIVDVLEAELAEVQGEKAEPFQASELSGTPDGFNVPT